MTSTGVGCENVKLVGCDIEQRLVLGSEGHTISHGSVGTGVSSLRIGWGGFLLEQVVVWHEVNVIVEEFQVAVESLVVVLELVVDGLEPKSKTGGWVSLTMSGHHVNLLQSTLRWDIGVDTKSWVLNVRSSTAQESDVVVRFNRSLLRGSEVSVDRLTGKKKTVVQELGYRNHCRVYEDVMLD